MGTGAAAVATADSRSGQPIAVAVLEGPRGLSPAKITARQVLKFLRCASAGCLIDRCLYMKENCKALVTLYQKVWCSGNLPESWYAARISYLHKKGRKTEVANYRPISLVSVLAKTVTKSWVGRPHGVAADHLVKEQGCGQKGQGAPEHLWAFMDLIEEVMRGGAPPMMWKGRRYGPMLCLLMWTRSMIRCGGTACT